MDGALGVGGMLAERDGKTVWVEVEARSADQAPAPPVLRARGLRLGQAGEAPPHNDQACESGDNVVLPAACSRQSKKTEAVGTVTGHRRRADDVTRRDGLVSPLGMSADVQRRARLPASDSGQLVPSLAPPTWDADSMFT